MKTKYIIAIFILGWAINLLGSLFKIMHWTGANVMLTTGTGLEVVGSLGFIYKLIRYKNLKEFLES